MGPHLPRKPWYPGYIQATLYGHAHIGPRWAPYDRSKLWYFWASPYEHLFAIYPEVDNREPILATYM